MFVSSLFEKSYVTLCQSLRKVQSSCPGQADFHGWASNFHSHLPNGQAVAVRKFICKLNIVCQRGKQHLRAACLQGKLEFKLFFQALTVDKIFNLKIIKNSE